MAGGRDAAALVERELDKRPRPGDPTEAANNLARRQAHAAVLLLQLEEWDSPARRGPLDPTEPIRADRIWPLLRDGPSPHSRGVRSYLIHRFARVNIKPNVLVERYETEVDSSARRALLLSLGEFKDYQLPPEKREPLAQRFWRDYADDPDPGVHSAIDWLLRTCWGHGEGLDRIDRELAGKPPEGRWGVTNGGHTLVVFRDPEDVVHRRRLPRSFALATKEVTVRQFREFLKATPNVPGWGPTERQRLDLEPDDSPVLGVSWFGAAQYCRWLSERDGIPEDQWCYPAVADIKDGMPLPDTVLSRSGYRLPTEAEWECACRAGTAASRPHGDGDGLLGHYGWYAHNAGGRAAPVGTRKPNDLGMFDMLGNAWEWCHDPLTPSPAGVVTVSQERVLRGGGFMSVASELQSDHRFGFYPQVPFSQAGFRVARTWR
jgi:formylglycine-generating enzyme required for sulfatase activity